MVKKAFLESLKNHSGSHTAVFGQTGYFCMPVLQQKFCSRIAHGRKINKKRGRLGRSADAADLNIVLCKVTFVFQAFIAYRFPDYAINIILAK